MYNIWGQITIFSNLDDFINCILSCFSCFIRYFPYLSVSDPCWLLSINKGINNHRLKEASSLCPRVFSPSALSSCHCPRISGTFRVIQTESMFCFPALLWTLYIEVDFFHTCREHGLIDYIWTKNYGQSQINPYMYTHSTVWLDFNNPEFFLCAKILFYSLAY